MLYIRRMTLRDGRQRYDDGIDWIENINWAIVKPRDKWPFWRGPHGASYTIELIEVPNFPYVAWM